MKGKTIIITGGSSGIGKACALRFAMEGSNVVISGRREEELKKTLEALHPSEGGHLYVVSDVSNEADCINLIDKATARFGTIDVLINNAGISMRGLFNDTSLEVIRKVIDTNFWGTVYCTKYALPWLLKSHGSLVGISSIAGKKGLPGRTGYAASKFAMEGFLETLRIENLKNNLHVLVACPGFTSSSIRMNALGPDGRQQGETPRDEQQMMDAAEVASKIYQAVVGRKRDLVLTFNGRLTLLLNKFIPGIMDQMVYNHMAKEPGSPFK